MFLWVDPHFIYLVHAYNDTYTGEAIQNPTSGFTLFQNLQGGKVPRNTVMHEQRRKIAGK